MLAINKYDQRIDFRCTLELKMYLIGIDHDHSLYIRDLINKDRIEKGDPKLIDIEIKKYNEKIQDLRNKKNNKTINQDKITEILNKHADNYKQNASQRSETQRITFIARSILPSLRKLGWKGEPREIDEILLNWPEE